MFRGIIDFVQVNIEIKHTSHKLKRRETIVSKSFSRFSPPKSISRLLHKHKPKRSGPRSSGGGAQLGRHEAIKII
jgi:hypothetical protein